MNRTTVRYNHLSGLHIDPFVLCECVSLMMRLAPISEQEAVECILFNTPTACGKSFQLVKDDSFRLPKYFLLSKEFKSVNASVSSVQEFELIRQEHPTAVIRIWVEVVAGQTFGPGIKLVVNDFWIDSDLIRDIQDAGLTCISKNSDTDSTFDEVI